MPRTSLASYAAPAWKVSPKGVGAASGSGDICVKNPTCQGRAVRWTDGAKPAAGAVLSHHEQRPTEGVPWATSTKPAYDRFLDANRPSPTGRVVRGSLLVVRGSCLEPIAGRSSQGPGRWSLDHPSAPAIQQRPLVSLSPILLWTLDPGLWTALPRLPSPVGSPGPPSPFSSQAPEAPAPPCRNPRTRSASRPAIHRSS